MTPRSAFLDSCSGRVIAVGSAVRKFRVGDWVACAGAGYAYHADMVSVPENLVVKVSDKKYLKAASLTAVGAAALQSIRRAKLQLGDSVCIIGLDLFGQLAVQLAKLSGAFVIGVDSDPARLKLATALGADHAIDATDQNVINDIKLLTEQHGADATIVAGPIESHNTLDYAVECTRKKGRVILTYDDQLRLNREKLHRREIDVLIACSCGPGHHDPEYEQHGHDYPYAYVRWTENRNMKAFLRKVETEALTVMPFIKEEIAIVDLKRKSKKIQDTQLLGLVLRYVSERGQLHSSVQVAPATLAQDGIRPARKVVAFRPATKAPIRVGVIGTQGDSKYDVVPLLSSVRNVSINAIVNDDIASSIDVAQKYGVALACSYDELFANDIVDAVVISSAHRFHSSQTLHALSQGRGVFLEKPLATDFNQLEQIGSFLSEYPQAPLCVDYSRPFAPFIEKIEQVVVKRKAPLVAHYRINTGFVPKDLAMHSDGDAGRIIGDASHIIDMFCFLTKSPPVTVSVESMHASRDDLFPTDNFSAAISFEDGSVCSLIYTTLGNSQSGSERMELFFDGKSILVDDYVGLYGFGLPSWFNDTVASPDYGQKALMKQFFKQLRKDTFTPPVPFERLLLSTKLTLIVDQLACEGGGTKSVG